MDLAQWVSDNLAPFLIFLGIALLAIEILVLGLSVFILLFIGSASILTGLLIYLSLLPANTVTALVAIALLTAVLAVLLWQPMKKLQAKVDNKPVKGDFIGHRFVLEQGISPHAPGFHRFSGVQWMVHSTQVPGWSGILFVWLLVRLRGWLSR